jgi:Ca2+:H+ antiporter
MVLLVQNTHSSSNVLIPVIQSAILGSILANLLLCLGLCFFVGGLRREKQEFEGVISEVGNGLLLTAGFGLTIPRAFFFAVGNGLPAADLDLLVLKISRATAVILLVAFLM